MYRAHRLQQLAAEREGEKECTCALRLWFHQFASITVITTITIIIVSIGAIMFIMVIMMIGRLVGFAIML